MTKSAIRFPRYNAAKMGKQLTKEHYDHYRLELAVGEIPLDKVDGEGQPLLTACWNWQGVKDYRGYGRFHRLGMAHRISAYLHGIVPSIRSLDDDDKVFQCCYNTSCCNPNHLYKGGIDARFEYNVAEAVRRQAEAEALGREPLTWDEVKAIRDTYIPGDIKLYKLAELINIDSELLGYLIHNRIWVDANYQPPEIVRSKVSLTDEQVKAIRVKFRKGKTSKTDIGKVYGISATTVDSIIKNEMYVDLDYTPPPPKPKRLSKDQHQEIIKLYRTGKHSQTALAKQFKADKKTIKRIVQKRKIK